MIATALDGSQVFYRAHTPEWASHPLSGAGAAKQGGRLNRQGIHALYLADSAETAIAEYQQLSPIMPPCTLVAYAVTVGSIVDFRGGYTPEHWSPLWQDLYCNWRKLALLDEIEPPSWILSDEVIAAGYAGVLFPSSTRTTGVNLVLYSDRLAATDSVVIHDPDGKLPQDRRSWSDRDR